MTRRALGGFTMVELIVATAVIAVLVLMLAAVTNHTGALWRQTTAKAEQFREVRAGFEAMTARLADATLNTYWGYNDASNPKSYQRCSDLRFISGPAAEVIGSTGRGRERPTHCVFFQAPATDTAVPEFRGFGNLLSTRGYYVELNDDLDMRPPFLPEDEYPARYRYRLMELAQPVEANKIYTYTSGMPTYAGREWFREAISGAKPPVHVLAENVIALLITPRLAQADEVEVKGGTAQPDLSPIAPDYLYDTSPPTVTSLDGRYRDARLNPVHQLPPVVEVTMVAIDEASALRLDFYAATHDPFAISRRFRQSADYTKDLALAGAAESLENTLVEMHVSYRVFRTKVAIRGAKWSREQRNLPPGS